MKGKIKLSQWVSFFGLGPVFIYPFSFCPFGLPYLYCFICPLRCFAYRIRGIVFLAALGLNFKKDYFCNYICPVGAAQIIVSGIKTKKVLMPKLLNVLKYFGLILIAIILVFTFHSELIGYKIAGIYLGRILVPGLSKILLATFLLSLLISIFNYRFFCHYLCPIKTISKILQKLKPIKRKGSHAFR